MAEKSRLASYQKQEPATTGGYLSRMLQSAGDEALGALERYGRRSGAQRDASLALMSQAADPNTDPLTGAGMKALGLAGLVTHPLAFFPTGDEWRERLSNAGNTGRMGQAIGGMLGDLPSIVDPHLLAGGGALAAAPLAAKMLNKADDVADAGIIAYHGSPHSFDKFDMSKIGTGEGNQDYSKGLYFAQNEDVAKSYRDVLSSNRAPKPEDLAKLSMDDQFKISDAIQAAGEKAGFNTTSPDAFWMVMNKLAGHSARTSHPVHDRAVMALDEVVKHIPSDVKDIVAGAVTPAKGSMYQVKIDAAPDDFLNWDKPLNAQSAHVDAALKTILKDRDRMPMDWLNASPGAEQRLKEAGVKGVRYLDQGSRGAGKGTYNYVVFDDKLITILKKYGIPMTAGAGGAMMVAGQDMPPEFASQMGGT